MGLGMVTVRYWRCGPLCVVEAATQVPKRHLLWRSALPSRTSSPYFVDEYATSRYVVPDVFFTGVKLKDAQNEGLKSVSAIDCV